MSPGTWIAEELRADGNLAGVESIAPETFELGILEAEAESGERPRFSGEINVPKWHQTSI